MRLNFLHRLANCPAGSYYSKENNTCVKCPLGKYQPVQGQMECVSCGQNLTTALNGTLEESACIGNVTIFNGYCWHYLPLDH